MNYLEALDKASDDLVGLKKDKDRLDWLLNDDSPIRISVGYVETDDDQYPHWVSTDILLDREEIDREMAKSAIPSP